MNIEALKKLLNETRISTDDSAALLQFVLENIKNGIIPEETDLHTLSGRLIELSSHHEALKKAFDEFDKMTEIPKTFTEYSALIDRIALSSLRTHLVQLCDHLRIFIRVTSSAPEFRDAIAPFVIDAKKALDSLSSDVHEAEQIKQNTEETMKFSKFIKAIDIVNNANQSPEDIAILDALYMQFTPTVHRGVLLKRYYIQPEQIAAVVQPSNTFITEPAIISSTPIMIKEDSSVSAAVSAKVKIIKNNPQDFTAKDFIKDMGKTPFLGEVFGSITTLGLASLDMIISFLEIENLHVSVELATTALNNATTKGYISQIAINGDDSIYGISASGVTVYSKTNVLEFIQKTIHIPLPTKIQKHKWSDLRNADAMTELSEAQTFINVASWVTNQFPEIEWKSILSTSIHQTGLRMLPDFLSEGVKTPIILVSPDRIKFAGVDTVMQLNPDYSIFLMIAESVSEELKNRLAVAYGKHANRVMILSCPSDEPAILYIHTGIEWIYHTAEEERPQISPVTRQESKIQTLMENRKRLVPIDTTTPSPIPKTALSELNTNALSETRTTQKETTKNEPEQVKRDVANDIPIKPAVGSPTTAAAKSEKAVNIEVPKTVSTIPDNTVQSVHETIGAKDTAAQAFVKAAETTVNSNTGKEPRPSAAVQNAAALAKTISESNITGITELLPLILQLLSESRMTEALVLVKASMAFTNAEEHSKATAYFDQLLHATNIPLVRREYTRDHITNMGALPIMDNPISNPFVDALKLTQWIWYFISPDNPFDNQITFDFNSLVQLAENVFDGRPSSINMLLQNLEQLKSSSPDGFSEAILATISSEKDRQDYYALLAQRADSLFNEPHINARMNGVLELISRCFGKNSVLYECLKIVNENDKSKIDFVENTISTLFADSAVNKKNNKIIISEAAVDNYLDKMWDQTTKSALKIQNVARTQTQNNIKKRLDVIVTWLEAKKNDTGIDGKVAQRLSQIKKNIINDINIIISEIDTMILIDNSARPYANILRCGLGDILNFLTNSRIRDEKYVFIDFLKSYQIGLDSDNKPDLYEKLHHVCGFEPWRRVVQHIASTKHDLSETLELIDEAHLSPWQNNYGSYEHISDYLFETKNFPKADISEAIARAEAAARIQADHAKSEFDLAFAYGRISEEAAESGTTTMSAFQDYFFTLHEYGKYAAFLSCMTKRIEVESAKVKTRYIHQLERIVNERGLLITQVPIIAEINKCIEEENLAVAHEYLDRLSQGTMELPYDEIAFNNDINHHALFMGVYDEFYTMCEKQANKARQIRLWGVEAVKQFLKNRSTNKILDGAQSLLSKWPLRTAFSSTDNNTSDNIVDLMKVLGFPAKTAENIPTQKPEKFDVFKIIVTPLKKNFANYSHPIADFGTNMTESLMVVCLYDVKTASELIAEMTTKLNLGRNTVVFLDSALSKPERRKVAEKIRSTSQTNTFVLVDRVLALYLASLEDNERIIALLMCALPYMIYQPFTLGVSHVYDEMFFGRKEELESILLPDGPALVYGGRQLGKTALLLRAQSLTDQPEAKKRSIYLDIWKKKSKDAILELSQELIKQSILKMKYNDLSEICDALQKMFAAKSLEQLYIFIDESDAFFEEAEKTEFAVLYPFVNLRRETQYRFRFVFAGLHNVARSKKAMENNSALPKLGKPLCIKPLSSADSMKLISKPLSFLGFEIERKQAALISANSNYYPGILQFICYTLVKSLSSEYRKYYSADENPPYQITDEHLKSIFRMEDLNKSIKEKVALTLDLDPRYRMIANIIGTLSYEDESDPAVDFDGYSISKIRSEAESYSIDCLKSMARDEFETILTEMADMKILWTRENSGLYRFRKASFRGVLGSQEEILKAIMGEN